MFWEIYMKKRLLSIIAVISAFIISLAALSGCNLVTTDNQRDMAQVVATVKISEDAPLEKIEKKEMVMAYLNYGYSYAQEGYTSEQIFQSIIDNLVNSRIMVQHAIITFDADASFSKREDEDKDKWDIERYLSDDDITKATYNTIKSMNTLIDNNEDDQTVKKSETYTGEVRTVPTNAAVDTEVSVDDMGKYNKLYEENGADIGTIGSERYKAYNKALKVLEDNGLLGEDVSTMKDTEYYKANLIANEENILIEKLQKSIEKEVRATVSFDTLISEYQAMYNAQVNSIKDVTAFETALSQATATSPVVYTPYTGYVYVYNLLLGANEYQTAMIKEINANKDLTTEQKVAQRKAVLASTTAKDLRESWIYSDYDFDFVDGTVTFKNDYALAEKSLAFQGKVKEYAKKTQETAGRYKVESVVEYGLDSFMDLLDEYVYDNNISRQGGFDSTDPILYTANCNDAEDFDARVNELLFAFSTDPGSLNGGSGYLITPKPDIGKNETFVQEFADAGRKFVDGSLGNNGYIVVGTDYGYHVMFFSKQLGANTNYATLVEYLNATMNMGIKDKEGWETVFADMLNNWEDLEDTDDNYLYNLISFYANTNMVISTKQAEIINTYKNDTNCVVKYADRYADLLKI